MSDTPIDSTSPAAQRILDGKYEIQKSLGIGGMGEVFLARHIHLEHQRVIKVLKPELAGDEDAQKRFLREARLATQIKHPNVSILYDYSRLPEGRFYMVWEYIAGLDIGRYLEQRGPFSLPDGVRLAIQALRGLGAIHTAGIVHRDISPDNLMLTRDGRGHLLLKIIDLGLAKALEPEPDYDVTQAGMFMGKLQYCSPEQAGLLQGDTKLDSRSDLYSFGLVLYEMLSGKLPYPSDGTPGAVFKRVDESPVPLSQRDIEGVPASLDGILLRTLSKDRDQRFASAVELIEALEGCLTELGVRRPRRPAGSARPETDEQELLGDIGAAFASTALGGEGEFVAPSTGRSSSKPITRQERQVLLAQIDRAAKKVKEVSRLYDLAEEALDAGRVTEARRLISELESASPRSAGLTQLKRRLESRSPGAVAAPAVTLETPAVNAASTAPGGGRGTESQDLDSDLDLAFPSFSGGSSEVRPPTDSTPALTAAHTRPMPLPPAPPAPPAPPVPPATPATPAIPAVAVASKPPSLPTPEPLVVPMEPAVEPVAKPAIPSRPPQGLDHAAPEPESVDLPATRAERVREAERMVESALAKSNQPLANLALSTLLELAPEHPKREEYESWIEMVGEETETRRRAEAAFEKGRAALEQDDLREARKHLDVVLRADADDLATALDEEIREAERSRSNTQQFDVRSVRFAVALDSGNLQDAEEHLQSLESLGLAKVTLDTYRARLDAAMAEQREGTVVGPFEERYRSQLEEGRFEEARAVARELAEELPTSVTPGRWLTEVDEREQRQQRRRSVITGASQVEAFIDAGDIDRAEMGLKILKQLAPEDSRWGELEHRIAALRS